MIYHCKSQKLFFFAEITVIIDRTDLKKKFADIYRSIKKKATINRTDNTYLSLNQIPLSQLY